MKTLQQAQAEKKALLVDISLLSIAPKDETWGEQKKRKKQITLAKKTLSHLKEMIMYLETQPKEEFLSAEVSRLKKRGKLIDEQYPQWKVGKYGDDLSLSEEKRIKGIYYKELGVPKLRTQLKTLNYLLS